MGKTKICIEGNLEKPPKINDNGTVNLTFKIPLTNYISKELNPIGESFYIVHVSSNQWKSISDFYTENCEFIIYGEAKASKTKQGIPVVEVFTSNIDIKSNHDNPSISEAAKGNFKKEGKNADWYKRDELVFINVKDISLEENIHLNVDRLDLNGQLNIVKKTGKLFNPIAVRPIGNNKYSLVIGVRGYCIAKILNLKKIKCIVTDDTHDEFCIKSKINCKE